jgi:hypothetical protein
MLQSCDSNIPFEYDMSKSFKYRVDTVYQSFTMIDSYGMSEEFYLLSNNSSRGTDYKTTAFTYRSVFNYYIFDYCFWEHYDEKGKGNDFSTLEITWNYEMCARYTFGTNDVYNPNEGPYHGTNFAPQVTFQDSLEVRGKTYRDIIIFDYTKHKNILSNNIPLITYISGECGLIKFIRKDSIVSERIFE